MLVCRKDSNGAGAPRPPAPKSTDGKAIRRFGEGGPVFLPRRRPSAITRTLLAKTERVTAYDDTWFAGRPTT